MLYTPAGEGRRNGTTQHEQDFWRSMFRDLTTQFPEPTVVVNDTGLITHWSDEQAEMLGIPRSEAIGTEGVEETLARKSLERLASSIETTTDHCH